MKAIINNIIDSYRMEAEAWSVLLDSTQRALEQAENKGKADEQAQRVESLVRNLIMDLNNLLARFYFLKDRQRRGREQMTDDHEKAVVECAAFVKSSAQSLSLVLSRCRETPTFEEEIDKEIRELEASVRRRVREFDEILDGTKPPLTSRIVRLTRNMVGSFSRFLRIRSVVPTAADQRGSDSQESAQDASDSEWESAFERPNTGSISGDEENSKCLIDSKA